ncbi:carbohydrate ABC transporter permease [Bradyrhizobium sp. 521_C7_N1_3]|uniref:carbohydrate ABC transporter permease n=1 Tax=Bradyrhizobium TaxID=374 RepID=UPI002714AD0F|nr:sugar ABC transporter permease [Bradyrhizobium japonicum]WLB56614.1 sugar ABC transporter permease [Bradyrhizobium japonicum]WLB61493.1 sugar ABC transporter permease [Bradyrhizobium japonicum]
MRTTPKWLFPVLALLPVLGLYGCIRVYPIIETLRLSLFQWNIISRRKPFVGLANFVELASDPLFLEAIFNTTIIAFSVVAITIPVALVLAALINTRQALRRSGVYEASVFLPHVVSLVPAAMAWKWIFDARLGPLNALISLVGIPAQSWLFDPVLSLVCLIVLCSWQAIGYAVLIFLVGLKNVPEALYEAARLDGASSFQAFRYIAVPLLKPVMLYVSVITLISSYNIYAQAFVLASDVQGAPGHLVRVLVLDMLENSFRNYRVGYAAAEAVVLLVIVLILTSAQFRLFRDRSRA